MVMKNELYENLKNRHLITWKLKHMVDQCHLAGLSDIEFEIIIRYSDTCI